MNTRFITTAYAGAKLALKAKAPTLMVVGGVVAMGAGTVLACKQTLKVEEVLAKHTPDLEKIKQGESLELSSYTKEVAQSDRFRVYSRAGIDLGRVYAVPVIVWGSGAALVFGGHRLLLQRNATLALAFTGLKQSFDAYRGRVVEHFGHEVDQRMLGGHVIREKILDEATGEVQDVHGRDWDTAGNDPYNRVFEQGASASWRNDLSTNKLFIQHHQKFAQDLLNRRGHLYLSEVYEALGFPESDLSRVVGWKVTRNADGSKDFPVVDFGLDKPMPDDWKYSRENAIYLDFNCQGLIVGGKVQKILERA